MLSVYGSLDGKSSSLKLQVDKSQLLETFPTAQLDRLPPSLLDRSEVDLTNQLKLASIVKNIMDQAGKKKCESSCIPVPEFLVNNPNISLIPAKSSSTSPKQLSKPVNRVSRINTVSTPISVVPVSSLVHNQEKLTKKCPDSNETKSCNKRVASSQINDRLPKQPKISYTKPTKIYRDKKVDPKLSEQISKLNAIEINQIKKVDSSSKIPNINVATSSISSTPSSNNRVKDLPFPSPPINHVDINCKEDSTNIESQKILNGTVTKYQLSSDGNLKMNQVNESSQNTCALLELRTTNTLCDEYISVKGSEVISQILTFVKSYASNGNTDTFIQCTKVNQSLEHNRLPEIKNVLPNLKLNPVNDNTISTPTHNPNLKHQSTTKVDTSFKSQRIQPQKSASKPATTIQISTSTKPATSSTNVSLKNVKPSDSKQVSSNQLVTPLKQSMATVTQIQSQNKPINKNQPPAGTAKVVSVTHNPLAIPKKSACVSSCVKPAVTCSSSLQDVKKCNKCNTLSDDDVCTTCFMSSQLKGVTLTRIETPGTLEPTDIIIDLDSDKDDEETCSTLVVEPTVKKIESKEQIKKYIDKLSKNQCLLDDKLWDMNLSSKDFFKFDQCHSIQIGNFNTSPEPSGEIIISVHGIRMTVLNTKSEAVTIDIPTENIVKIYGNYVDTPKLVFYTNYLAAVGIQYLLNMDVKIKNCLYDPLSEDTEQKKIIWSFSVQKSEVAQLEKLLLRLNGKYEPLTSAEIRSISSKKTSNKEKEDKEAELSSQDVQLNDDTVIVKDILGDRRVVIRVRDYKMLSADEYLNDIILEFYMNRWYMRLLSPDDFKRTYVFSTYFYTSLIRKPDGQLHESKSKLRHNQVRKWTKNVQIFDKDFVFIPINESSHWFMIVVCYPHLTGPVYVDDGTPANTSGVDKDYYECRSFNVPSRENNEDPDGFAENLRHIDPYYGERMGISYEIAVENMRQKNYRPIKQPCILVFDSLHGPGVCRARNVSVVREWLAEEYSAKHNGETRDFSPNVVRGHTLRVPQQTNFTDCGLFVLHFFEKFFQRPIVDYSLPILHLENWFHPDEVQKNCQKRRDVTNMIVNLSHEQNLLPSGAVLPELKYTSDETNETNEYLRKHYFNTKKVKNLRCMTEFDPRVNQLDEGDVDEGDVDEGDVDEDDVDEDDVDENYIDENDLDGNDLDDQEFDEQENDYDTEDQPCNSFTEEDEYDGSVYDYFPEGDDDFTGDRNNSHQITDYVHSEQGFERISEFDNMNPDQENVINVDDSLNGSLSERNHQNIPIVNYGLYRSNNLTRRTHDEDYEDDDNEDDYDDEDDEDDESNRSTSFSSKRNFKRPRLSNQ